MPKRPPLARSGAGDVEAGVGAVALGQAQPGERQQADAERDVQPEDPLPGDVLGEGCRR